MTSKTKEIDLASTSSYKTNLVKSLTFTQTKKKILQ